MFKPDQLKYTFELFKFGTRDDNNLMYTNKAKSVYDEETFYNKLNIILNIVDKDKNDIPLSLFFISSDGGDRKFEITFNKENCRCCSYDIYFNHDGFDSNFDKYIWVGWYKVYLTEIKKIMDDWISEIKIMTYSLKLYTHIYTIHERSGSVYRNCERIQNYNARSIDDNKNMDENIDEIIDIINCCINNETNRPNHIYDFFEGFDLVLVENISGFKIMEWKILKKEHNNKYKIIRKMAYSGLYYEIDTTKCGEDSKYVRIGSDEKLFVNTISEKISSKII